LSSGEYLPSFSVVKDSRYKAQSMEFFWLVAMYLIVLKEQTALQMAIDLEVRAQ